MNEGTSGERSASLPTTPHLELYGSMMMNPLRNQLPSPLSKRSVKKTPKKTTSLGLKESHGRRDGHAKARTELQAAWNYG